jgi:hypothetical protein
MREWQDVHEHVHSEVGDDGHPGNSRRFAQLIPEDRGRGRGGESCDELPDEFEVAFRACCAEGAGVDQVSSSVMAWW